MKTKVKIKKISNHILNFLTKFIALGLFSGRIPKAPGTFGSIVGIIISVFFVKLSVLNQFLILVLTTILGTLSIYRYLEITKQVGNDPKEVVIDEIVAVLFICLLAQYITPANTMQVQHFCSIFILFRIFDITKPYPICVVDKKMKNPIGIMLDDLLAGFASWLVYICMFA